MAVTLTIVAQSPRNLVLVGAHVVPVAVLAAKAARYVGTQARLGGMPELAANVAPGRSVAQNHVVELERELEYTREERKG